MIRIAKPSVATSIQDRGRYGYRSLGFSRSGAMDVASLEAANRCAGADPGAACIEFGPGRFSFEMTRRGTVALSGAVRGGAPWNRPIEVEAGTTLDLTSPQEGVWSYLSVEGGIDAPIVKGSRASSVAEGIGRWLRAGDVLQAMPGGRDPEECPPLPMSGEIRTFGEVKGRWKVSATTDRMGYRLEAVEPKQRWAEGKPSLWSEPLLPGSIQLLPTGDLIVLMAEAPTVGGYPAPALVHSEDLRLVAQARPGVELRFQLLGETALHF